MIVIRAAARSVLRRPGQAVLIGIAIVAATAFAAASLLIALNARTALVAFGMSTPAAADAVVLPHAELATEAVTEIAERARTLPGVDEVAVEYLGDVEVQLGGSTTVWKLTSDPGTGPLSGIGALTAGAPPEVGEVVIGSSTAERSGASVGDVFVAGGHELTVAGIGQVHEFGQDVALIREQDAVAIGDAMTPMQIFVTGEPDLDVLSAVAGESTVVGGEERRAEEARSVTDTLVGVFGALTVFVGLAVLSAVAIVSSTFRILLARRAAELALLRCVGASRAQVRHSVLVEAAFIGLVGGAGGVAVGLAAAAVLVAAARGAGLVDAPFDAAPAGLIACLVLAAACSIVAALPAAQAAGRTSPVAALGEARSSDARPLRGGARGLTAVTAAAFAAAAAIAGVAVAPTDEFLGLALAALSGTLVFAALVAVGPFLIRWSALLLRPLASRSVALRLTMSNARRASRRTAAMTTVLTLGVGLTAALTVGVAGATADAEASVARNFPTAAIIPVDLVDDPDAVIDRLSADPNVEARLADADILIDPAPGVAPEALRSAVLDRLDAGIPVYWAADVQAGIEQTILIGQLIGAAMIGVTLLVAMIGVSVTLALSVAERRQEIALLRALGVSRAGTRRSVAAEAALAATIGAGIGVAVGCGYGLLALHSLGMAGGVPPFGALAVLGAGVVGASVLSALAPMRTASRVQPAIGVAAR
ncbi:FtsX-like permease family protein [Pseudoclavibacter sp. VKM Ac-2867]|uniref:FtsX-like permease family protein n=1 Tax=Pseudoclavibacter sp. VKM Ac-2867 TaxID=2783829 RepID=UPI00188B1C4B|nr:FtsX-like permease family protein [Pseudoclavibacter sp. VKM Ac-2867]MBF4459163.1 FtsX-like permease family protein [Pseudoclavibacter sp. VKM Ac-2867]